MQTVAETFRASVTVRPLAFPNCDAPILPLSPKHPHPSWMGSTAVVGPDGLMSGCLIDLDLDDLMGSTSGAVTGSIDVLGALGLPSASDDDLEVQQCLTLVNSRSVANQTNVPFVSPGFPNGTWPVA